MKQHSPPLPCGDARTLSYFRLLKKYGGIDFIFEHWWALHTDNPFWAVRDIYEVCRQNGGMR